MFFVVAACLVPGSDLTIAGVGLNPTRTGLLDVLGQMGADIETEVELESGGEPVGTIRVRYSGLRGVTVDPGAVPAVLDEVPILAIAASQADGETVIGGAAELRVKESDRIAAMVEGLRALGADAEELPDGLVVRGPAGLVGGDVDARGDHRVAMSFAVAGLVAEGNVRVEGWSSVETSFPDFLDVLGRAQGRLS
jgi:3-phosphoshikimate 1-carboxyvinyltransferase